MEQVPPPFIPGAPPFKKKNTALIWTIVCTCLFCFCLLPIGGFWWAKVTLWDKAAGPLATCMVSFADVRAAILTYAKSHDGKLPDAANWQDSVRSFYQDEVNRSGIKNNGIIGTMDAKGDWGCPSFGNSPPTGMAFNSDFSGKQLKSITNPEDAVLIFEIPAPAPNAHETYKEKGQTAPAILGAPRPWLVWYVKESRNHQNQFNMGDGDTRGGRQDPYQSALDSDKSKAPDDATKSDDSAPPTDKKDSSSSSDN